MVEIVPEEKMVEKSEETITLILESKLWGQSTSSPLLSLQVQGWIMILVQTGVYPKGPYYELRGNYHHLTVFSW